MKKIHHPAVAGMFYPGDAGELRRQVQIFLGEAHPHTERPPKALIAPHAGYIYSGPVAASAYALLPPLASRIKRVVLLAPAHRYGFRGIARSSAEWFRTPLGDLEVDRAAMTALEDLPYLHLLDAAFEEEHSIEVHLPFLQETLDRFRIVPLLVGDAKPADVCELLERVWGGDDTLIVISSDLSHYMDYDTARRMDGATTQAIERMAPAEIGVHSACGRIPVSGLLLAAKHHKLQAQTLDLRNSGDTAGPRTQVVGYGAYAFF